MGHYRGTRSVAGNESPYTGVKMDGAKADDLPTECLIRPGRDKQPLIDAVEICKVGINLHHPVCLDQHHRANVDATGCPAEERFILEPGNDVVQAPGRYKQHGG
jgi:hypothetical protein